MALERVRDKPKPGDNVSDATRQDALRELSKTYAAIQAANANHRNKCKHFQGLGVKTNISMRVIRDRYKDPAELLAEIHEEVRQRALDHMPSIQQDLMDLWKPIELAPDERAEHDRFRRRDAGAFAAREGHTRDTNPYLQGTEDFADWDSGWLEDQTRIAKAMANGGKPIGGKVDASKAKSPRKTAAAGKADATVAAATGGRKRGGSSRRATTH